MGLNNRGLGRIKASKWDKFWKRAGLFIYDFTQDCYDWGSICSLTLYTISRFDSSSWLHHRSYTLMFFSCKTFPHSLLVQLENEAQKITMMCLFIPVCKFSFFFCSIVVLGENLSENQDFLSPAAYVAKQQYVYDWIELTTVRPNSAGLRWVRRANFIMSQWWNTYTGSLAKMHDNSGHLFSWCFLYSVAVISIQLNYFNQ